MITWLKSRTFAFISDLIGVGVWGWLLVEQVLKPWSWWLPVAFTGLAFMVISLVGRLLGWDKESDDEGDRF